MSDTTNNDPHTVSMIVNNAIVDVEAKDANDATNLLERWRNSNRESCPKCGGTEIKRWETTDGCRMNGDAYGKNWWQCQAETCKWKTYTIWDDYC